MGQSKNKGYAIIAMGGVVMAVAAYFILSPDFQALRGPIFQCNQIFLGIMGVVIIAMGRNSLKPGPEVDRAQYNSFRILLACFGFPLRKGDTGRRIRSLYFLNVLGALLAIDAALTPWFIYRMSSNLVIPADIVLQLVFGVGLLSAGHIRLKAPRDRANFARAADHFIGGILMVLGVLLALLSGGCAMMLGPGSKDMFPLVMIASGIPFLVGIFIFNMGSKLTQAGKPQPPKPKDGGGTAGA